MSSAQTAAAEPFTASADEGGGYTAVWPVGEVLRDIARGGFAGAIAGILFAGVGGRLVMRLAALIVPTSVGSFTENGNRIGDITLGGSVALLLVGLIFCLIGGTFWVIVSPWIPGTGVRRALLTIPVAIALTATGLIEGGNQDFFILRHDARVVAVLVAFVALVGFAIAMIDSWLERRLPHPETGRTGVGALYTVVVFLGAVLILPIVVGGTLLSTDGLTVLRGVALVVVGLATLGWWILRVRGQSQPSTALIVAGRAGLVAACAIGFVATVQEIGEALGIR